ncbi:hypothetical protein ATK23_0921 [Glutamicibacter mysorens]|uniref:Lipoprotein n=1 Tax=Glutamicibacter mysorens TaxID=257984 RepID=A0ABX4MW21_9MICC|nr:hypothetical protein ATK23_0921 [Glutamicibacter mysorens]
MNSNARTSRTPIMLASTAAMAALLLTGCGQGTDPGTQPSASATASESSQQTDNSSENAVDQDALLQTNDQLSEALGDDYVQGWIKDGKLNVSTTSEEQLSTIEEAGAVGHLVQFSSEELRSAISEIMKWQSKQENPVRNAIHAYTLNPETGGITLSVDKSQLEAVEKLIDDEKPIGEIPVDFKESGGIMTPAATQ